MANATSQVQEYTIDTVSGEKIQWPLDSYANITGSTFYTGAMVGVNDAGYATHFDDTAPLRFAGVVADGVPRILDSGDAAGALPPLNVERPGRLSMATAWTAAITDVGKLVYAAYDNSVQLSTGTYGNLVGVIVRYISTSRVEIAPLYWNDRMFLKGAFSLTATGAQTLDVGNLNKTILAPITASLTLTLPAVANTVFGDRIRIVKTTSDSVTLTLDGNASETINGATTYATSQSQYSVTELFSDGTQWFVSQPSLTTGATTFTGNVATSGATVTVDSTSASALDVGPNGATHPALQVDCSASSAATGLKLTAAAAASGFAMAVISSGTDEDLTIDAKGSGTITLNGTGTGTVSIGSSLTLSAKNIITDTSTGMKIGTASTQKLGFFNATPVVQPSTTGTTSGFTAGGGTAANDDSTFTGGTGSSAYTVGDLVLALKHLGLLAA